MYRYQKSIFSLCFKPFTINLRPKDFISYSNTHSQPIDFEIRGRSIKTQLSLNNIESISSLIAFAIKSYTFFQTLGSLTSKNTMGIYLGLHFYYLQQGKQELHMK